jgi:hypothetical protein
VRTSCAGGGGFGEGVTACVAVRRSVSFSAPKNARLLPAAREHGRAGAPLLRRTRGSADWLFAPVVSSSSSSSSSSSRSLSSSRLFQCDGHRVVHALQQHLALRAGQCGFCRAWM